MDLLLIRTFLKVATAGSITKAAAVLFVTQSAVSRRIKQLEEYVGTPLFERSGTLLKLTSAGHMLMDKSRKILEIEQDFFRNLNIRQKREKISFCCTPSLGIYLSSGFLRSHVANQSRETDFSCVFSMPEEALAGIDSGKFHFALLDHCDDIGLGMYSIRHLPDDEVVFVSSPSRGIKPGTTDIRMLFEERLFLKNQNGCAKRFIDKSLKALGYACENFAGVSYFDDLTCIVNEVRAGGGIAFVSKKFVEKEIVAGALVFHTVPDFNHFRPRTMILAREKQSPEIESFIAALLDYLQRA